MVAIAPGVTSSLSHVPSSKEGSVEKRLLIWNFCPFSEKEQFFPGVPDFSLISHWPGLGHMTIAHYKKTRKERT